jgi:hypothetical protein
VEVPDEHIPLIIELHAVGQAGRPNRPSVSDSLFLACGWKHFKRLAGRVQTVSFFEFLGDVLISSIREPANPAMEERASDAIAVMAVEGR